MMRRVAVPVVSVATAAQWRGVTNYNFGQTELDTEFLPRDHYQPAAPRESKSVRVSKLPNGARVITHDRSEIQTSIGVYVEAGAKFDPAVAPGLSNVLRWSLSGSNVENSLFQIDRNARAVGASREHCEIRKRWVGLKTEVATGSWERVASDLFTSIAAPRLPESDTERFRDVMDNVRAEMRWNDPRAYAIDELETVAFFREPLGNPRLVAPEFNGCANHARLVEQWSTYCRPSRVVIAGVNVDHDALVAAYENCEFPHSESAPHHAANQKKIESSESTEAAQYYPGNSKFEYESRAKAMMTKPDMDEETIVAVGFPAAGRDQALKPYATSLVVKELASMAFGETTRRALNADPPRYGTEAFYRPFSSTGLLGATIRSDPQDAKSGLVDAVAALRGLSTGGAQVKAAARRAAVQFAVENLEVNRDYCDFLATSIVGNDVQTVTAEQILQEVEKVDAAAVKQAVDAMKKNKPAVFATGEVTVIPSVRQLAL